MPQWRILRSQSASLIRSHTSPPTRSTRSAGLPTLRQGEVMRRLQCRKESPRTIPLVPVTETTVAGRDHGLARNRIRDLGRSHELGLVHARGTLDGRGTERLAAGNNEVIGGAVVEVAVAIGATEDAMTGVAAATEAATDNPIFARENVPRVTPPSGAIRRLRTLANAGR
jgi:hypothetical protein